MELLKNPNGEGGLKKREYKDWREKNQEWCGLSGYKVDCHQMKDTQQHNTMRERRYKMSIITTKSYEKYICVKEKRKK